MSEPTAGTGDGVIEPVHWGSRLVRSASDRYTEVDGTPVLVQSDQARVEPLTPTWAGIWARLDGQVVTDALGVDPDRMDPVDARNLLEVLRRLKASGSVVDASDGVASGPDHDPSRQEPLEGWAEVPFTGSVSRDGRRWMLDLDPEGSTVVTVRLHSTASGPTLSVRRRLRRRRIDQVRVGPRPGSCPPATALERFVGIIGSVRDRTALVRPALVDLLAALAERADEPGSLPR